jgi:cytoskeletal protein RodZ
MKTIGEIIRNARTEKRYSFKKLEEITKIKSSFIESVEKEDWKSLPAFPTVLGFVKNIAAALEIDEKMAAAVLKRDYPPKKLEINPNPDIRTKPSWSPKLTFALGIGAVIVAVLGYLIYQYVKFTSPPELNVVSPVEGQIISGSSVLVFGSTDADVKITVDNQPVLVDEDGKFTTNIEISPTTTQVVVKAVSRSGKQTTIERKIEVQ